MNTALKSTLESGLVALFAACCCLWFLISAASSPELGAARVVMLALALAASLAAHWALMALVVRRSGRSLWLWLPALIIFLPIGSVVLMVLVLSQDKAADAAAASQAGA